MTKAEQRAYEKEQKYSFIKQVTETVLKSIGESLVPNTTKVNIRLTVSGNNRYFDFHRYCEDMSICIYTNGNVSFCFKEFCHSDVNIQEVLYEELGDDKREYLKRIKEDVDLIITIYLHHYWHGFLDYMCHLEKESDWRDVAKSFLKECCDL